MLTPGNQSLLPLPNQPGSLDDAQVAARIGVPDQVITDLRAGNPVWTVDEHLRAITASLGVHAVPLRGAVAAARARIWHGQRFETNNLASFGALRKGKP